MNDMAPRVDALVSAMGLSLPDDTTFEDWLDKGRTLLGMIKSANFMLGDLLLHGERHFPEVYAQLIDEHNAETCRKALYVCSRVPLERRLKYPTLYFSHFDAVASLTDVEQDEFLESAVRSGWRRSALREEIARRHPDSVRRGQRHVELDRPQVGLVKAHLLEPVAEPIIIEPVIVEPVVPHASTVIGPLPASDEAARYLKSLSHTAPGRQLREYLTVILEERDRSLAIVAAAERAVQIGTITDELAAAFNHEGDDSTVGEPLESEPAQTSSFDAPAAEEEVILEPLARAFRALDAQKAPQARDWVLRGRVLDELPPPGIGEFISVWGSSDNDAQRAFVKNLLQDTSRDWTSDGKRWQAPSAAS